MARQLEEIIQELDAGYNPSRQLIDQKINSLAPAAESEIAGLKAQEQDYFTNTILGGARERGLGFSGIPESERARYGATQFLPAVARVREAQNTSRNSLLESLNALTREQRDRASGIREGELNRDEQMRQFNEQLAAQERERQRAAAGARSGGGGGGFSLGGPRLPAASAAKGGGATNPIQQAAYNDVQTRVDAQSDQELRSDYLATATSAKYGNQRDAWKLKIYRQIRPDLFKHAYSWEK